MDIRQTIEEIKQEMTELDGRLQSPSDRILVFGAIEKYSIHLRELAELELEERKERIR